MSPVPSQSSSSSSSSSPSLSAGGYDGGPVSSSAVVNAMNMTQSDDRGTTASGTPLSSSVVEPSSPPPATPAAAVAVAVVPPDVISNSKNNNHSNKKNNNTYDAANDDNEAASAVLFMVGQQSTPLISNLENDGRGRLIIDEETGSSMIQHPPMESAPSIPISSSSSSSSSLPSSPLSPSPPSTALPPAYGHDDNNYVGGGESGSSTNHHQLELQQQEEEEKQDHHHHLQRQEAEASFVIGDDADGNNGNGGGAVLGTENDDGHSSPQHQQQQQVIPPQLNKTTDEESQNIICGCVGVDVAPQLPSLSLNYDTNNNHDDNDDDNHKNDFGLSGDGVAAINDADRGNDNDYYDGDDRKKNDSMMSSGSGTTTSFILPTPPRKTNNSNDDDDDDHNNNSENYNSSTSPNGRRRNGSGPTSPFSRIKHEITEKWKMVDWITQCHNPLEYYLPFDFDPNNEKHTQKRNNQKQVPAEGDGDDDGLPMMIEDEGMPTAYLAFRVPQHCEYCGQSNTSLCDPSTCTRPRSFLRVSRPPPFLTNSSSVQQEKTKDHDTCEFRPPTLKSSTITSLESKQSSADDHHPSIRTTATDDMKIARDKESNEYQKRRSSPNYKSSSPSSSSSSPPKTKNDDSIFLPQEESGIPKSRRPHIDPRLEPSPPGLIKKQKNPTVNSSPESTTTSSSSSSSELSVQTNRKTKTPVAKILPYRGNSQKVIGPWLKTTPQAHNGQQSKSSLPSPSSSSVGSTPTLNSNATTWNDQASISKSKTFPTTTPSQTTKSDHGLAENGTQDATENVDGVSLKARTFQC